ncbi:hypothetical protein OG592_06855 [Streptomyces avidinii]|uniref:SbtR family transcriptional regulator n=1 Tax=Streptomyces avidinii TaxID=1895 RepID=UPI003863EA42|nr:hypothetical protein OG592_06855 [Streptomyces avidinii]
MRHYLMEAAGRRSQDRALEVVLANASVEAEPIARMRDDLARLFEGLVERAVAGGAVRRDFAAADVYAFLHMVGAVADRTHDIAPHRLAPIRRGATHRLWPGAGPGSAHVRHDRWPGAPDLAQANELSRAGDTPRLAGQSSRVRIGQPGPEHPPE